MDFLIALHRGRNRDVSRVFKSVTTRDYNFDFRGIHGGSPFAQIWLLVKAWITAREIPPAQNYLIEGGLVFWVGFFLKRRYPQSKLILYVPEPAFYCSPSKSKIEKFLFHLKIRAMAKAVGTFLPISRLVAEDCRRLIGPQARIRIVPHAIEMIDCGPAPYSKNVLMVVDRPSETGHVKGLDIGLEIFRGLKVENPGIKLHIVGSGTESLNYNDPDIRCLGYQPVTELYRSACLLIAPSRYDALNRAAAEAASAGLWVLISKRVGLLDYFPESLKWIGLSGDRIEEWVSLGSELLNRDSSSRRKFTEAVRKVLSDFDETKTDAAFVEALNWATRES